MLFVYLFEFTFVSLYFQYKVRAYSLAGHVDTTCYVKLCQLSPSFSKSLGRALEVEEGEPLQLTCKVEASPIASVKW